LEFDQSNTGAGNGVETVLEQNEDALIGCEELAEEEDQEFVEGLDDEENLAYPGFAPKVFYILGQTTRPRSWCLAAINWPYPFLVINLSLGNISFSFVLLNTVTT